MLAFLLALTLAADSTDLDSRALSLLATYADRAPAQTAAAVAGLVNAGEFPQRPRMMVWLGTQYLSLGDVDVARHWLHRVRREYHGNPWAGRALFGLAEAASRRHRFLAAEAMFRQAAREVPEDAMDALGRAERARTHFWEFVAALLGALAPLSLAARGAAAAFRTRGLLFFVPFEVKLLSPAAIAFAALAFGANPQVRHAVWVIVSGMIVLLWANALCLAERPRRPVLHLAHAAGSALGLAYAAVWASDMIDPLMFTLRAGALR